MFKPREVLKFSFKGKQRFRKIQNRSRKLFKNLIVEW